MPRSRVARRKLAPLPIEWLYDNPGALALPAAGLGILIRIVLHYWATDCRELPLDYSNLFAISRAHRPTFAAHFDEILSILLLLLPELRAHYDIRQSRIAQLKILGEKGSGLLSLRAAQRRALRDAKNAATLAPVAHKAQETRARDRAGVDLKRSPTDHGAKRGGSGFMDV